jgi:hypothetical protein
MQENSLGMTEKNVINMTIPMRPLQQLAAEEEAHG